jgi:hypothetical protein
MRIFKKILASSNIWDITDIIVGIATGDDKNIADLKN